MTSPSISISIMAHPRRASEAEALAVKMRHLPTRIVYDPDPDGPASTIRAARLAWAPWRRDATHHLVLQDDVFPHQFFEEQVLRATDAQPDALLSFFSEWGSFTSHALRVAAIAGRSWVTQPDTYLGTQAVLMPAAAAKQFASDLRDVSEDVPDDHAIHEFAYRHGLRHYVSNPNLVEHDVGQSLVGNGVQGARRATVFLPHHSADIAWWRRAPLEELHAFPAMQWSTAEATTYVRAGSNAERWSIEPPRDWWGDREGLVQACIRDVVAQSPWTSQPRVQESVKGIASVLSGQVRVASSLQAVPADSLSRLTAADAVRTIAPGSMRRRLGAGVHEHDLMRFASQLQELLSFCQTLIANSDDRERSLPRVAR
ncbi:hypothetical protein QUG98_04485 [Curtobacterium sp. RHCJP20]|uniref:Glycosyltransferase n=1 Tax=Curtobacterium subtropicum TaxID=3055138 RepID=A0ABT7TDR3_9MICO|nr:hypothetical protein [Curtobacterium subtropicum]MDM7887706.1 hypothetical protein [Curtobacterium subtropicum]